MTAFEVAALRREFPALTFEQDGRPLAFFDGPGGTRSPSGSSTRSSTTTGPRTRTTAGPSSRASGHGGRGRRPLAIADLLNARSADEVKFGQNMTSLTLHVSRSIGASLQPGDESS